MHNALPEAKPVAIPGDLSPLVQKPFGSGFISPDARRPSMVVPDFVAFDLGVSETRM